MKRFFLTAGSVESQAHRSLALAALLQDPEESDPLLGHPFAVQGLLGNDEILRHPSRRLARTCLKPNGEVGDPPGSSVRDSTMREHVM